MFRDVPEFSYSLLVFWILVSSFCSSWMFISSFWSTPLIWVLVSFLSLLVPCTLSFVSLFITFTFSSNLQLYSTISVSILITHVSNSVSDTLAISSLLMVVFLELWSVLSFGPYFFVLSFCTCYMVRSGTLGICQGGATHVAALLSCMWGRGLRGNNVTCSALCWLSITSSANHRQIGPFWCWFLGWWVCVCSRTLWVCPTNSSVRLGVSPVPSTSAVFSVRGFEALFPRTASLSYAAVSFPRCSSLFIPHKFGTACSSSHCFACPGPPVTALPQILSSRLPVSARPTNLDECFFFNTLVIRFTQFDFMSVLVVFCF